MPQEEVKQDQKHQEGTTTTTTATTTTTTIPDDKKNKPQDGTTKLAVQESVVVAVGEDQHAAALSEPDALPIVLGDSAPASVAPTRKKELLLQARKDRRKWVLSVPLPFEYPRDPNDVWSQEDRLAHIQSTPLCTRLPAVTKLLSHLYGVEDQGRSPRYMADRIESLIGPIVKKNEDDEKQIQDPADLMALASSGGLDPTILTEYEQFISTLLQPECALVVQGMRNFLRSLHGVVSMDRMATLLKNYLETTYEALKTHIAFKNQADNNNSIRRSLESFLYGHCQPFLNKLEWNGLFSMPQEAWIERITQLQFVQPAHLEIACLEQESNWDELLAKPIQALLSVDRFFSPYEKLQRILALYQGVNAALSTALNQQHKIGDGAKPRKLPSADDVLPTIILTVLRAKPHNMLRNLQLVEVFCPPEYLRGEAGYAYTNLYGAVQFLQDLDMDQPNSLSISPEEFKKGIAQSRQNAEVLKSDIKVKVHQQEEEKTSQAVDIRVQDVRSARLRGENVDLDWALQWQKQQLPSLTVDAHDHNGMTPEPVLPEGFSRSYSFLGSRPEHIRLSDLPKLLEEYSMLVHATEHLLMERASRHASEKRRKKNQKQEIIRGTVVEVEVEAAESFDLADSPRRS